MWARITGTEELALSGVYRESTTVITLSDNCKHYPLKETQISIGTETIRVILNVLSRPLQLLISVNTLKKLEANINIAGRYVEALGENVHLKETSAGHSMLPFNREDKESAVFKCVGSIDCFKSGQIEKLLKQYVLWRREKVCKLIENAGKRTPDIINTISKV